MMLMRWRYDDDDVVIFDSFRYLCIKYYVKWKLRLWWREHEIYVKLKREHQLNVYTRVLRSCRAFLLFSIKHLAMLDYFSLFQHELSSRCRVKWYYIAPTHTHKHTYIYIYFKNKQIRWRRKFEYNCNACVACTQCDDVNMNEMNIFRNWNYNHFIRWNMGIMVGARAFSHCPRCLRMDVVWKGQIYIEYRRRSLSTRWAVMFVVTGEGIITLERPLPKQNSSNEKRNMAKKRKIMSIINFSSSASFDLF